ncbi:MAG: sugar-binding transcriptional regulator [Inquilinaceae bacterium]
MGDKASNNAGRLDEAARAGWLYYVAGNTQDQIARKLGVSRQSAQRLVSLAISERLVKVRVDHPIARCMELADQIRAAYHTRYCEVVPSDPDAPALLTGVAIAGAAIMEQYLKSPEPKIIALGTGRALRACVEQLPIMDCPQHRIVSLLGNMMNDGAASSYNVVVRMAERVNARHYPMPLPVLAADRNELEMLHALPPVRHTLELCRHADISFVGVGQIDDEGPLIKDGFVGERDLRALEAAGGVGEITSWVFDKNGTVIATGFNERVLSAPLRPDATNPVVGIAIGAGKVAAIRGALKGRLIDALITNEATAERILQSPSR